MVRHLGKIDALLSNNRGLSPIFATVLLASIIIIFGSVAYYYSSNLTTTATNNYVNELSNSQQSLAERIGFENVVYSKSSSTLTVYVINSGSANNLKINSLILHNTTGNNIVGVYPISNLKAIDGGASLTSLNVGKEGYFSLGTSLNSGSLYTIQLITQSGSSFYYEFAP